MALKTAQDAQREYVARFVAESQASAASQDMWPSRPTCKRPDSCTALSDSDFSPDYHEAGSGALRRPAAADPRTSGALRRPAAAAAPRPSGALRRPAAKASRTVYSSEQSKTVRAVLLEEAIPGHISTWTDQDVDDAYDESKLVRHPFSHSELYDAGFVTDMAVTLFLTRKEGRGLRLNLLVASRRAAWTGPQADELWYFVISKYWRDKILGNKVAASHPSV